MNFRNPGLNKNIDNKVVADFGREWTRYDQSGASEAELLALFERYFAIFPLSTLSDNSCGFDLGCGSGRWARFIAPRVGELHCIDPSADALAVARRNLESAEDCRFHLAAVDAIPLDDCSMDFGYSLGVLHHVPDTAAGLRHCVDKLKPGAPFLLYLYYAFDNRPYWFRLVWRISDILRLGICVLPYPLKAAICQLLALLVYFPLARLAGLLEKAGMDVSHLPLSSYRDKSLYTMRTDALDRFGTRLEKRFTRDQIHTMMESAGLSNIRFSDKEPYWCAVGYKTGAV